MSPTLISIHSYLNITFSLKSCNKICGPSIIYLTYIYDIVKSNINI